MLLDDIIVLAIAWWPISIPVGLIVLGVIVDVITWVAKSPERRHRRRIELIQARAEASAPPALPEQEDKLAAGPCPHRPKNVKPVFDALGNHVRYLCTACDEPLPKEWAVQEEDL